MNIPVICNIGDHVWIWQSGQIREDVISKIFITLTKDETKIRYETSHYHDLTQDDENTLWFRSRQDVVDYVNRTVLTPPPPEPTSEKFVKIFKNFLRKKEI